MKLILSCEHAVNDIPNKYQKLFQSQPAVLETHEGYDPGAMDLFKSLKKISNFSSFQKISRLLVETNRSIGHPKLFSRFSNTLSSKEKTGLLNDYYIPYCQKVIAKIKEYLSDREEVIHFSVHSFTSILNNEVRNCDIGLLYDPSKNKEKQLCKELKIQFITGNPGIRTRFNYPYLGKSDGFTTSLRRQFPENYLGIEIEINQKWVKENRMDPLIKELVFKSIEVVLSEKNSYKKSSN